MIVVPQGCWHRFHSKTGVRLMTVTPQPTDHSRTLEQAKPSDET